MSGSGVAGGWDTVYRFGSFICAVLSTTEARNEDCCDGREDGLVSTQDGDFQLMYVRRFLCEADD